MSKKLPIAYRPGVHFKNGKLYHFDYRRIVVMRLWPDPMAWMKTPHRHWRHDRKWADTFLSSQYVPPEGEPLEPEPRREDFNGVELPDWLETEAERAAYPGDLYRIALGDWKRSQQVASAMNGVPNKVRSVLSWYNRRRWHLLNLFARCPGAMDLQESNPALCFALASNWVFHTPKPTQPMRAARSLVRKKQKDILGWLGFPATNSCREVLRKLPTKVISIERLLYLRDALHCPELAQRLRHLPRLNAGALRLATDPHLAPCLSPRLLLDVCASPNEETEAGTHRQLLDTLRMDRQLGGGSCPTRFESVEHLTTVHNRLAGEVQRIAESRPAGHFPTLPSPPYVGTPHIVPLTTASELIREGREMNHCAASYVDRVARGTSYLYRVTHPVRATLEICFKGMHWSLGQIHMAFNQPVEHKLREEIFNSLVASGATKPGRTVKAPNEVSPAAPCFLEPLDEEAGDLVAMIQEMFGSPPEETEHATESVCL